MSAPTTTAVSVPSLNATALTYTSSWTPVAGLLWRALYPAMGVPGGGVMRALPHPTFSWPGVSVILNCWTALSIRARSLLK